MLQLAPPSSPPSTLLDARSQGRRIGCRVKGLGVDCPYSFDVIDLRQQWFAGFSEGRRLLRQIVQADHGIG